MSFPSKPKESKNQINKAGDTLVKANPSVQQLAWALNLTEKWRACHAYPINTFQSTLRRKLKTFPGDPFVAQRLKRMPTIIDKLKRFPAMPLAIMQDIGGVRAVLSNVSHVYKLNRLYQKKTRFTHVLIRQKDYIKSPRDEDGYRSVHLIYKYKNSKNTSYDGLILELQLRSKLQHIWATAVETMGTFLGQALKSRQGDQEWIDFFALTSSAIAHKEKCPAIPRFKHLSKIDTFKAVAKAEADLRAIEKMSAFSVAVNEIVKKRKSTQSRFYHLIILNSLKKSVEIKAYDRNSLNQALNDYKQIEAQAVSGQKIEPVLVSAGPLNLLRRAYPNFFLDIREFVDTVNIILKEAKE